MKHYDLLNYAREIGQGLAGWRLTQFAGIFGPPAGVDKDFLRGLVTWTKRT